MSDLFAKLFGDVFSSDGSVFHRIVQQAGRDRGRIQLHLCQHLGDFQRV